MIWRLGYHVALWLALPAVLLRLWWRGRREPGYREHVGERFGFYRARPQKDVIWLHAVSVGETRAAEPLVRALKERFAESEIVVTQMTAAGREAAQQVFGDGIRLAYLAYDYPFAARRFLAHFRPRLGILMETEIWFNLVRESALRGVPLMLANARMSARSARGYGVVAPLVREALEKLSAIGAQTRQDADRLVALGAREVEVTGNLKFDVAPPAGAAELARQFRAAYGPRKVFLVASTREGEEDLILDALDENFIGEALTVIVPRHPQRFDEVAKILESRDLRYARRSSGGPVPADCPIVLGDSMGEMAAYYGACDAALVGGSLLAYGGQNLIEACALGVPVLIGPHTYNFAHAADSAVEAGAAIRVESAADAVRRARELLQDPPLRRRMSAAGIAFCAAHRGATERTLAICERLVAKAATAAPAGG